MWMWIVNLLPVVKSHWRLALGATLLVGLLGYGYVQHTKVVHLQDTLKVVTIEKDALKAANQRLDGALDQQTASIKKLKEYAASVQVEASKKARNTLSKDLPKFVGPGADRLNHWLEGAK